MSLFGKTDIKPEMEHFIRKGEGVGIVKVEDYGKASARIESHKIILESYDDEYPIIESIATISYLSYDPGNFFQEPKLEIGFGQKEFTLAGVDNNDDELEAFYKSILNLKNKEKQQKTTTPQIQDKIADDFDELDEIEEQIQPTNTKDTSNKIKGFLSKRFEETSKPEKTTQTKETTKQNISNKINGIINKPNNLEQILDDDIEDDEEEILLNETPKPKFRPKQRQPSKQKEDFDEFDEIEDFDEFDDFQINDEIILEEDFEEDETEFENEFEELTFDEKLEPQITSSSQETISESSPEFANERKEKSSTLNKIKNHVVDLFAEEIEPEEEETTQTQQINQPQEKVQPQPTKPQPTKSQLIKPEPTKPEPTKPEPTKPEPTKPETIQKPETKLNKEITQAKQQVTENINNINQEISTQMASNTLDPVYQIRRYYELKEDGIITEEEFQQKKKQLLEL